MEDCQRKTPFLVVIINNPALLSAITFYRNVEFIQKKSIMDKNPLTKLKNECIMISANEKIASLNYGSTLYKRATPQRIGEL